MVITIGNVRQALAVLTLGSILLAGAVSAAQENDESPVTSQQPFVSATNSALGEISIDTTSRTTIFQDVYLAATSTPTQTKIVTHTPKVTARTMYVASTGYNSEVAQTDDSPFIAADGSHVYWGMVAANFLPFGTKIKIPDYYGDKVFVVHDRMNKRYWERVDVWFPEKTEALQWGVRTVKIEILES